ncbi:dihydrofolate reductase family protein [Streptomyces hydrogenans]|uniref:dihydrofolate reductase family protein n=2 Tax=Streptomyces hydrogenans TaxID=1873719 RepID=UPI0035D611F7
MTFTATVFIGTSLDGYIARPDDDIEWLTSRGEQAGDMGFFTFLDSVDAVVMGRKTYEKVIGFGEENWPYGDRHVGVLSTTLPTDADPRVTVYRSLDELFADLDERGIEHVYPDGGRLVQSFLRAGRVDAFIISLAPVLIGAGHRLFGDLTHDVPLRLESATDVGGGFAQLRYTVEKRRGQSAPAGRPHVAGP